MPIRIYNGDSENSVSPDYCRMPSLIKQMKGHKWDSTWNINELDMAV